MNNNDLLDICNKKFNKDIDIDWNTLADQQGFKNGEALRCWYKRHRKKNGLMNNDNNNVNILHISDLHYPYALPINMFKDYVNKVDILVLNGDIQDCQSISKFIKRYRVPFIEELVGTRDYLIKLITYINPKKVVVNYGNHCLRLLKALNNDMSSEFMALMPKSSLSLIFDLGFWKHDHEQKIKIFFEPLINVFKNKIEINYTDNWYCRIGNTIFAHPSAFRQGILKTTEQAYLHFLQKGEELFDCLVLAHTHSIGFSKYNKTYLYESGCCCKNMEYHDGKLIKPQNKGFLFLIQDNKGNFIYDKSKIICLD